MPSVPVIFTEEDEYGTIFKFRMSVSPEGSVICDQNGMPIVTLGPGERIDGQDLTRIVKEQEDGYDREA